MALMSAKGNWPKCLFLRDELSDCEVLVQTPLASRRFPCHRVILSAASEVFAVMFQHDFKEGETGKITVEDVNPDIMYYVLKYIYYGRFIHEDWKEVADILRVAHKYGISNLIEKCENFLSRNLSLENVCTVLELAALYDLKKLEYQCLKLCSKACFAILRTNAFIELSSQTIKRILLMDDLNVENEMMIFKAVWEWAIIECCKKKRRVTQEYITEEISVLMDCIGFEFMTDAEINTLPKTVLQKYCLVPKKLNQNGKEREKKQDGAKSKNDNKTDEVSSGIFNSRVLKRREATFPLDLQDHLISFKMAVSYKSNTCIKGNHTFLRFSMNWDVYLNSLTIICLKDSYPSNVLESLHLSSNEGTLASYTKQENDMLLFQEDGSHAISTKDSTQVQKIDFRAMKFLLIKADVEYTLEVNRSNSSQNCALAWPEVKPLIRKYRNVDFKVHSEKCYALTKMTVIKA